VTRVVYCHTPLSVEDTLSGEEVLSDFTCLVAEVFPGQPAPSDA
jgi:hypothetical protein